MSQTLQTTTGQVYITGTTGALTTTGAITEPAGAGTQTGKVPCTIYSDLTATGSTGGGAAATVSSYAMPANTLSANGQRLHVDVGSFHAANTNTTTLAVSVFGTTLSTVTDATSGGVPCAHLEIVRVSSSVAIVHGFLDGSGGFTQIRTRLTGLDFTTILTILYTVQAATTTNDLIGQFMRVTWYSE